MFYCEKCKEKNNWPSSLFQSFGMCEICAKMDLCYDVHSSKLPPAVESKKIVFAEDRPKPKIHSFNRVLYSTLFILVIVAVLFILELKNII